MGQPECEQLAGLPDRPQCDGHDLPPLEADEYVDDAQRYSRSRWPCAAHREVHGDCVVSWAGGFPRRARDVVTVQDGQDR